MRNETAKKKMVSVCNFKADQLIQKGIQFVSNATFLMAAEKAALEKEFCINSTIHRGYYNPSPVYDIIVGNTKRGRISANPHAANITHCYYYNQAHELIRVDCFFQNKISYTELFFREDNTIYGFTVDCNNRLSAVSKEIYDDGRIISFALAHCIYIGSECRCFDYLEENYQYDSEGLHICHFMNLVPRSECLIYKVYEFERMDGFLVSYFECLDEKKANQIRYRITKRRKA